VSSPVQRDQAFIHEEALTRRYHIPYPTTALRLLPSYTPLGPFPLRKHPDLNNHKRRCQLAKANNTNWAASDPSVWIDHTRRPPLTGTSPYRPLEPWGSRNSLAFASSSRHWRLGVAGVRCPLLYGCVSRSGPPPVSLWQVTEHSIPDLSGNHRLVHSSRTLARRGF
jgi:hypothetical protein